MDIGTYISPLQQWNSAEGKEICPRERDRIAIVSIPSKELQSELAKRTQGKENLIKNTEDRRGPVTPQRTRHSTQADLHL